MDPLICVQCGKHNDPVTLHNGKLVEDAEKKLVPLHHVCVGETKTARHAEILIHPRNLYKYLRLCPATPSQRRSSAPLFINRIMALRSEL